MSGDSGGYLKVAFAWDNTKYYFAGSERAQGALQVINGGLEVLSGTALSDTGVGAVVGLPLVFHGGDNVGTGMTRLLTGEAQRTLTYNGVKSLGGSDRLAYFVDEDIPFLGGVAAAGTMRTVGRVASMDGTLDVANAVGGTGAATRLAAGERYNYIVSSVDATKLGEYDALNPGPLPDGRAGTFSGGRYAEMTLNKPTVVYRAWSPGTYAAEDGAYWSLEQPVGTLQAKIDSALLPEWGGGKPPFNSNMRSQANNWTAIELPQGTTIFLGEVGGQHGIWVGGASQLLIKGGPDLSWKIGGGILQ